MNRTAQWLWLIIAGATALAAANWWVQDDAYISFLYAQNLIDGHGLVFNIGEPLEGYTNFLWTVVIAGAMKLGADPRMASVALGLAAFPFTLLGAYLLARELFGSAAVALLAVALLGTNYTFSIYATGGLETQWNVMWLTWCLYITARAARRGRWDLPAAIALSILSALALLTRLDAAVMLLVIGIVGLAILIRQNDRAGRKVAILAALVLPAAAIGAPWLVWKYHFYGELLPNTLAAKTESRLYIDRGAFYFFLFFFTYLLFPIVILHALVLRKAREALRPVLWGLVYAPPLLWMFYILWIGGDFMEFRFMTPISPLVMILAAWTILAWSQRPATRAALVAMLLIASAIHAATFDRGPLHRFISGKRLFERENQQYEARWIQIGHLLAGAFPQRDVVIAVDPAGIIPYYSRLPSVDKLGLNDKWVARHGAHLTDVPGHRKIATIAYMLERKVNLVIGHPEIRSLDQRRDVYTLDDLIYAIGTSPDHDKLPSDARAIEIPVNDKWMFVAAYLTPSPVVDAAIAEARLARRSHGED